MNLARIIERHAAGSVALRHAGSDITYGELRARAGAVRRQLAENGVAPGERVALVLPTSPAFVVAYFGVLGSGAVAVPLNPSSPRPELERELAKVKATAVIAGRVTGSQPSDAGDAGDANDSGAGDAGDADDPGGALEALGYPVWRLTADGLFAGPASPTDAPGATAPPLAGEAPPPPAPATSSPAATGQSPAATAQPAGATPPPASGAPDPPIVDRDPDATAVLLFTSGTAGAPKAAVLTHGSLLANIEQMELSVGLAVGAEDVGVLVVPPFHVFGLNAVLGVQMFAGGTLVLVERFEPAEMLEIISAEKVTILVAVPQLFAALASVPAGGRSARADRHEVPGGGDNRSGTGTGDELASVRLACSGAAPLPLDTAEAFEARFGVPIWQGYGLTEASPAVTFPDLAAPRRPLSVGLALPGVELRIVDVDGHDVEAGDPGEILVRGPNVFAGYFDDRTATARALDRAGWLHTGDVAVMAEDGSLTLVDRTKDIVIVSGFNVFPAEVEQVLETHPAVAEAAVIGMPDAAHGEAVRAFVVPVAGLWADGAETPHGLSAAELVGHSARFLARYKCPTSITFVRELPRGVEGKVVRRAVRSRSG